MREYTHVYNSLPSSCRSSSASLLYHTSTKLHKQDLFNIDIIARENNSVHDRLCRNRVRPKISEDRRDLSVIDFRIGKIIEI